MGKNLRSFLTSKFLVNNKCPHWNVINAIPKKNSPSYHLPFG